MDWFSNLPSGNSVHQELGEIAIVRAEPIVPEKIRADLFARHQGIPGHQQLALESARILMAGAGGLNSWSGLSLVRAGAKHLTIADHDLVELSNLPRQLFFSGDEGEPKAVRLAHHLAQHAVGGATIVGIAAPFEEVIAQKELAADIIVCGVDSNACRLACAQFGRSRKIPVVFTMLSNDATTCHCFLQEADSEAPCLWCARPNLDPEHVVPCASAIVSTCLLASAFTTFFVYRALMGWPAGMRRFNWREFDVTGSEPERTALVMRRQPCWVCVS